MNSLLASFASRMHRMELQPGHYLDYYERQDVNELLILCRQQEAIISKLEWADYCDVTGERWCLLCGAGKPEKTNSMNGGHRDDCPIVRVFQEKY